jgi:hypothetical protein
LDSLGVWLDTVGDDAGVGVTEGTEGLTTVFWGLIAFCKAFCKAETFVESAILYHRFEAALNLFNDLRTIRYIKTMLRTKTNPFIYVICNAIIGGTYTAMIISDIRRESAYMIGQNKEIMERLRHLGKC